MAQEGSLSSPIGSWILHNSWLPDGNKLIITVRNLQKDYFREYVMNRNDLSGRIHNWRPTTLMLAFMSLFILPFAAFGESKIPKPFKERQEDILVENLLNNVQVLSPYQRWLLLYWQKKYAPLLDQDGLYAEYQNWVSSGSPVVTDLKGLFTESGYIYLKDLRSEIKDTDLIPSEKAFLDILLLFLLDENSALDPAAKDWYLSLPAEDYIKKYPDSSYRPFVQDVILKKQKENSRPITLTFGASLILGTYLPFGNISDYTKDPYFVIGFDFPLAWNRVVLSFSILIIGGPLTKPITYEGTVWQDWFSMQMYDFSIGYKIRLSQFIALTPRLGIGATRLSLVNHDPDDEISAGLNRTHSFGIALELFRPVFRSSNVTSRWAITVDYRHIPNAWDEQLTASGLLILASYGILF